MGSRATTFFSRNNVLRCLGEYVGAVTLSVLVFWQLYDLWGISLRSLLSPLVDDALAIQATVFKGGIENPGIYRNTHLGAPFGMELFDAPMPDLLIWGAVKLCGLFTTNHLLVRNLVVLGGFPLMTITSLYAMRRLGIGYLVSLGTSLLFSFSYFHHWRSTNHISFAIGHFTLPIVVLLAIDLAENRPLFLVPGSRWYRPRWANNRLTWLTLGWCVVIGTTGSVYYPYFTCYFLIVASIFAATRQQPILSLARGLVAVAAIAGSLALSFAPTIWNNWRHGVATVVLRGPSDTELYGLKFAQLVTPGAGHRIDFLRRLGEYYNANAQLINENRTSYIGLVGVVGLFALLYCALRARQTGDRLQLLSVLTIAGILMGTVGGFSAIMSLLVDPTIRSVNRICVYIGYFALLALAMLSERLRVRIASSRWRSGAFSVGLAGTVLFGLYDQHAVKNDYSALKKDYERDARFVQKIEASVPKGSSIFQYPYFPYPENGWINGLSDYALLTPYIHSKSLNWSFGSIKTRRGAAWNKWVASLPARQAAETLVLAGFSGVFVARAGYADEGAGLEAQLREVLGEPRVVDPRQRVSFFTLNRVERALKASLSRSEFRRRSKDALSPLYLGWVNGFFFNGTTGSGKKSAMWLLHNPGPKERIAEFKATVRAVHPEATVRIAGEFFSKEFRVAATGYAFSERIEIPPGEHFVHVDTTEPPGTPYEFGRRIVIHFENVEFTTLPSD